MGASRVGGGSGARWHDLPAYSVEIVLEVAGCYDHLGNVLCVTGGRVVRVASPQGGVGRKLGRTSELLKDVGGGERERLHSGRRLGRLRLDGGWRWWRRGWQRHAGRGSKGSAPARLAGPRRARARSGRRQAVAGRRYPPALVGLRLLGRLGRGLLGRVCRGLRNAATPLGPGPAGRGGQGVQRYRWYQRRRVERHAVNASCS